MASHPCAGTDPSALVGVMRGLGQHLSVEFKKHLRMVALRHKGRIDVEVAGHAGVGPGIEVGQFAKTGGHMLGVGGVSAGVE